jgi:hypothetical protein
MSLNLEFTMQHNIPANGTISVILPGQMRFIDFNAKSSNVSSYFNDPNGKLSDAVMTNTSITFTVADGYNSTSDPALTVTLLKALSPRSFKPSDGFNVTTFNPQGYSIDNGGSDITVAMSVMT